MFFKKGLLKNFVWRGCSRYIQASGQCIESGELDEDSVVSILETTATDGKSNKTKFYNLDAVISDGSRVNSSRATQFRIWATRILKEYIIKTPDGPDDV